MDKETMKSLIAQDEHGLLDIESKANWMIYGNINGKRGGAFFGFDENDAPVFGGGNLMHEPMWWNTTFSRVDAVCDKIKAMYPDCTCSPNKRN